MLNNHHKESDCEQYMLYCVYHLVSRLKNMHKKVSKRKQSSSDRTDTWSQARYLWSNQLPVKFDLLNLQNEAGELVQRQLISEAIGSMSLDKIIWWDETHCKCKISDGSRDFVLKFKIDNTGTIDLERR